MSSISYLMTNLSRARMTNVYTVGAADGFGFYIQIPWHLRGAAAELMDQFVAEYAGGGGGIPVECLGFEFRDNGVQIQRHRFAWK